MSASGQETRRLDPIGIVRREQIAGQLQADEFVIGEIAIESGHDPVAVGPGVGPGQVAFEAVAFAEADHVEPVPGPTFAVMGARQQAIDQALDKHRRWSRTKASISSGAGGRPSKSNDSRRISVRRSASGAGVRLALSSRVRIKASMGLRPTRLAHGRDSRTAHRLERPPIETGSVLRGQAKGVDGIAAPLGSPGDPVAEQLALGLGQRFLGRHLAVAHALVEGTVVRLTRLDGNEGRFRRDRSSLPLGLAPSGNPDSGARGQRRRCGQSRAAPARAKMRESAEQGPEHQKQAATEARHERHPWKAGGEPKRNDPHWVSLSPDSLGVSRSNVGQGAYRRSRKWCRRSRHKHGSWRRETLTHRQGCGKRSRGSP